jgi:hypothetical protein
MTKVHEQTLLEKLRQLAPERVVEVEHFVDFLAQRQAEEHCLAHAASLLAEPAFAHVWDNSADADYDRL